VAASRPATGRAAAAPAASVPSEPVVLGSSVAADDKSPAGTSIAAVTEAKSHSRQSAEMAGVPTLPRALTPGAAAAVAALAAQPAGRSLNGVKHPSNPTDDAVDVAGPARLRTPSAVPKNGFADLLGRMRVTMRLAKAVKHHQKRPSRPSIFAGRWRADKDAGSDSAGDSSASVLRALKPFAGMQNLAGNVKLAFVLCAFTQLTVLS